MSAPVVECYHGFSVVRDDLLPGGTKCRALEAIMLPGREYVYAGPAQGFAQVALAETARRIGARATVFVAKRKDPHPLTRKARDAGAKVYLVPHGYLSNVQSKAKRYAADMGAELLPFGINRPDCLQAIADAARAIMPSPEEVWSVAGSGVLTRALQGAWPDAAFHAVVVGKQDIDTGAARRWNYPLAFEKNARVRTPFPSVANYDAKGWEVMLKHGAAGALFWNVAAC